MERRAIEVSICGLPCKARSTPEGNVEVIHQGMRVGYDIDLEKAVEDATRVIDNLDLIDPERTAR